LSFDLGCLTAVTIGFNTKEMVNEAPKPVFYVVLSDLDQWAVEAEWPDGTLERVDTFKEHSAAASWIATQSEPWWVDRWISRDLLSREDGIRVKPP
jgi:hypothetical protein